MKVKNKKVYYCDFCKKHSLIFNSIKKHEEHCTLNPNRTCGLCDRKGNYKKEIKIINKAYKELMSHKENGGIVETYCRVFEDKVKEMLEEIECPVCMLSILRLSDDGVIHWANYSLKEEIQKYWKIKAEEEEEETFRNGY